MDFRNISAILTFENAKFYISRQKPFTYIDFKTLFMLKMFTWDLKLQGTMK